MRKAMLIILSVLAGTVAWSQVRPRLPIGGAGETLISNQPATGNSQMPLNNTNAANGSTRADTLGFEHRDDAKDSITISYRFLDSTSRGTIDSSINDFDRYFSVPSSSLYLGNNGAASYSLIFKPNLKAGFDEGFHAFDIYKYTVEGTRFYKTSRPFTTICYQLASGKEQMLMASHTQNPRPNLNWGFDYRLITAPGFFITQNANHNGYRLYTAYQGKRKRYNLWMSIAGNNIRASENGGVASSDYLSDPNRKDRFSVPVNLGNNAAFRNNPFVTTVLTGHGYRDFNFFLRQSYDVGKKDSLQVNDSTTEYLFYPKWRFQHSITASRESFAFTDVMPDSAIYADWFGISLTSVADTFRASDKWNLLKNDFSIIQYPDTKNTAQFFLAGATWQLMNGRSIRDTAMFHNIMLHAEYRNRTRNKRWDMLAKGELYVNGYNQGDYSAFVTLSRMMKNKKGSFTLFFNNVNRTPSFVFDPRSSFSNRSAAFSKKENITLFGAMTSNPILNLSLTNQLLVNYTYFSSYRESVQNDKPVNVIQLSASKKIRLSARLNWYPELTVQQSDKAGPVRLPLLFTRNRLAFEGIFFKNLNLSTGLECRYFSPFKANGYAPVSGQFVTQDTFTLKNLPDLAIYTDFRIKGFSAYIRAENLNTVSLNGGFAFLNNNFAAPLYPTQGFIFRLGIRWWFVN